MTNELKILSKPGIDITEDYIKAEKIALELIEHLNNAEIMAQITNTHKLFAKSHEIQKIFLPKALELGFVSEKKGLFSDSVVSQLRPDYFLKLSDTSGIIMEVERGKTLANNMDLLDLWKCHICKEANFLFLIVPNVRANRTTKTNVFPSVVRRLSTFFSNGNFTNVDAAFIFGY